MEPVSVSRVESFRLLGIQVRIDPWKADYPAIWEKQYMPYDAAIAALADGDGQRAAYFECDEPDKVDMFLGRPVRDVPSVPDGLTVRGVPAATYAVFECGLDQLAATWRAIYEQWLPQSSDYTADENKACFEAFPPDCGQGRAPVSVHVAVMSK